MTPLFESLESVKDDYSDDVKRLYAARHELPPQLDEQWALRAGMAVESLFPPADAHEVLTALAALNLLNAAVKQPWGERVVTYHYIKGMAACLFIRQLCLPLAGVSVYFDPGEQVAYFTALGVQISFHYIPLYRELLARMGEASRHEQQWVGMRLQEVAVPLFQMAASQSGIPPSPWPEQQVRLRMLHYHRPAAERLFGPVPFLSPRQQPPDGGLAERPRRRKRHMPFVENKADSLATALSFNMWHSNAFTLWRRKDSRPLSVVRYDGTNYRMLMGHLLRPGDRIYRRPEHSLQVGKLYHVSPQKRVRTISPASYVLSLSRNSYLFADGCFHNLCVTYGIARYLSVLYPELSFVCTLQYNHLAEKHIYYQHNDLYSVPLDDLARRLKAWIIIDPQGVLATFSPSTMPQWLIDDYMQAEDHYQEFEITTAPDGRKGIRAYRRYELLPPVYEDIRIRNYHAHVLGDNGRWAIYALCTEEFKTDFVYDRIWYDTQRGAIVGSRDGRITVIVQFRLCRQKDNDRK